MHQNIGMTDRFARLVTGYSLLGFGVWRKSAIMVLIGAEKIAEGTVGFCVTKGILQKLKREQGDQVVESVGTLDLTV